MFKEEFCRRVTEKLKADGIKREIRFPSHTLTLYNIDGSEKNYKFRGEMKEMYYTYDDVRKILDAITETTVDAIREGNDVSLYGFGRFYSKQHKGRRSKDPRGGEEWYDVPEFRVPKFQYGNALKLAAKSYGLVLKDDEEAINLMPKSDEVD